MQERQGSDGWYPPIDQQFDHPGRFQARIIGIKPPSFSDRSGMALEIEEVGGTGRTFRFAAASERPGTYEKRGMIAAAIRVVQALHEGSEVDVYTREGYAAPIITNLERYSLNDWRGYGDRPLADIDLWQELWNAAEPRRITVRGHHAPDCQRFQRLKEDARAAVRQLHASAR